jgi:cytoskeletal protein CcmA (bactofilin family)
MPNINDRIGSQNVIRVLSNASAPPTRLVNLSDVDSTLKTRDGMILVWDLGTETFFMTDSIDSSTLNIAGIVTFSNTENSTTTANGALIVSGGIGVGKKVNIGEGLTVAGVSTFASNLDINAAVDILNGLNVADDLVLDEITARNATLSGDLSVDGHTELDDLNIAGVTTTGGLLDINNGGQANTFKVEDLTNDQVVIAGTGGELEGDANFTFDGSQLFVGGNLRIAGISTFVGGITFQGDLDVDGHAELDDLNVSGVSTFGSAIDVNAGVAIQNDLDVDGHTELDDLNVSGVSTFVGNVEFDGNVSIAGTLTYEDVTNVDAIGLITARSGIEAGFPGAASTLTAAGDLTLSRNISVAGLSTFVGIGTFSSDVFVAGTLTAGLIDGGIY